MFPLLLLACTPPPATPAAPSDSAEDTATAPSPWDTPFPWALATPNPCPVTPTPDDVTGQVLTALGLDWDVGISERWYRQYGGNIESDPARLSHFHRLQNDITELPCFAGNVATRADLAATSDHPLATRIADAATQLDRTITVGGTFPTGTLEDALDALSATYDPVTAAALPAGLRDAVARVLFAAAEAAAARDEALTVMLPEGHAARVFRDVANTWLPFSGAEGIDPDDAGYDALFVGDDAGSGRLYAGAARLAQALDETDWEPFADPFEFRAETRLGVVLLRGGGDDLYEPDGAEYLLVVDTGGDDTYTIPAGATQSIDNPVSVLVDLGGDDLYAYPEVPDADDVPGLLPSDEDGRGTGAGTSGPLSMSATGRQGSGVLGYGFLVDRGGGHDVYRSLRKSQGFASVGVGVLHDDGGADQFEVENGGQGAAVVGIALLVDGGGDDTYRAYGSAQGFAWVSSFGALHDAGGNDTYEAVVDDVILLYSPQQPGVTNSSTSQGCAFGWRRDDTGTHLSGGLAILRDADGDDTYEAAVFAQGAGYWMGMGILADAAGDDRYDGVFYTQGATAHFALAAFLEGSGDDVYTASVSSSIGLAHDYSATVFVEGAGNDTYFGVDRSIGASKCHGLSVFVERAGDDLYQPNHNRSIGWATDYDWAAGVCGESNTIPSYAFFADADGTDTYARPDPTGYGDGLLWITDDPDDPDAMELSGGVDVAGGVSFAEAYGG